MESRKEAEAMRLAEEHIGLVFHWASVCKRRKLYQGIDPNELIQEGCCGLLKAAQKYDPDKGQFSTYATKWIRSFIRKFRLRSQKAGDVPCDSRRIDTRDLVDAKATGAMTACSVLDSVVDSETATAIAGAIGALDARARDIVTARFGLLGKTPTYRELGKRHGISGARVQQIEKKALEKMRKSKLLSHLKTK